jgi:hypothetical protein
MATSGAQHDSISQDRGSLLTARSNKCEGAAAPSVNGAQTVALVERLAYTVEEAALVVAVGRDLLYDEIRTGRLRNLST